MTPLKCATHVVADVEAAAARFTQWLEYRVAKHGVVEDDEAALWCAPATAGRRQIVLRPASGTPIFVRLVEGDPVEDYRPIRTYGWAATEICIQDVAVIHERMRQSPFEVIGPPKPIPGLPVIHPMQVLSPDREIIYLTEIKPEGPEHGLPAPRSLVDHPFILVLASRDMAGTRTWFEQVVGLTFSDPMAIPYSMINKAFGLPADTLHTLTVGNRDGWDFIELDQYPAGATPRPRHPGALPPGVAICTLSLPDIDRLAGHWAVEPRRYDGPVYDGRRVGMLETPEGALLEIVEAS